VAIATIFFIHRLLLPAKLVFSDFDHNLTRRNRRALLITETELKLIAAAAIIGLNSKPKNG
jgi:hypothetical protein